MKIVSNGKTIEIPSGVNGIPAGGTTGQMLAKASDTDFDTQWVDTPGAEEASGVTSFNGRNGSVVPQEGDYTAEMVGAYAKDQSLSASTRTALGIAASATPDAALQVMNAKITAAARSGSMSDFQRLVMGGRF